MKDMNMTTAKQTFPAVSIEALPNGLLRLEDETSMDGIMVVDLHPAQVQVLASMVGFTMPDKSRAELARLSRTATSITKQAHELKSFLGLAVDDGVHVGLELNSAENIAARLDELLQDLEAIQTPDLEPIPDALANPGGQMTIDL